MSVGQSFSGWKLTAFRPEENVLVLGRDGREVSLKLASSPIGSVDPTQATVADANALLEKMKFAEMFAKIVEQQKNTMVSNAKGVDAQALAEFQDKAMDVTFSGMTAAAKRASPAASVETPAP